MTRKSPEPLAVYILDDDDAVRCGFARLVRSAGIEARPFASAAQFLAEVTNQVRACILLDITMPGMTGMQVQEELNNRGITLPVITVSARDDEDTRAFARALGAKMFLRKPVDDQALLDAINWVSSASFGR
jgi:FixJ family two-component response regulator